MKKVQPGDSVKRNRTGILVVLDGLGINSEARFNAVALARKPTLDSLFKRYPHTILEASEGHVGLPDGFSGDCEVGHLTLGAGRVVCQGLSLINQALEEGTFFRNPALMGLMHSLRERRGRAALHLVGLISEKAAQSHVSHVMACLELARRAGIQRVFIHAFTDGKDSSATEAIELLLDLQKHCRESRIGKIASVAGRDFGMNQDQQWDRTHLAYQAIVAGQSRFRFSDPVEYVRSSYDENVSDESIVPAVSTSYRGVRDGDGFVFFNFRPEGCANLAQSIVLAEFSHFRRENFPTLSGMVMMYPCAAVPKVPAAFEKPVIPLTLGEVVSEAGWAQLRVAEPEKFDFITRVFSGGVDQALAGEKRIEIVRNNDFRGYDLDPQMGAEELTRSLISELNSGTYRFAAVNYAAPDMVGHTGNLKAARCSIECIDECLAKIVGWVEAHDAFAVVTSDHGNCERMFDETGCPDAAHTLLPVPFLLVDPMHQGRLLGRMGSLSDVAPTILSLWGLPIPSQMSGTSLVAALQ